MIIVTLLVVAALAGLACLRHHGADPWERW